MITVSKRNMFARTISSWAILIAVSVPAQAAVPDLIYVHCNGGGGDFRISELNHTVAQFSARYQQYRPVCPSCEILEWGDRITMKDTTKTYIQFDRMTGDVVIERAGGRLIPGASYRGLCTRGTVVTVKSVRAF